MIITKKSTYNDYKLLRPRTDDDVFEGTLEVPAWRGPSVTSLKKNTWSDLLSMMFSHAT